jgi:hypothetical protein
MPTTGAPKNWPFGRTIDPDTLETPREVGIDNRSSATLVITRIARYEKHELAEISYVAPNEQYVIKVLKGDSVQITTGDE